MNVLLASIGMSSSGTNLKGVEGSSLTPSDVAIRWVLGTFPSLETSLNLTPERAMSFSRQFSLVMVGLIVLGSVRLVLRGVNQVSGEVRERGYIGSLTNLNIKVLRVTSKNLGASLMLLILAQLMVGGNFYVPSDFVLRLKIHDIKGMYLLSTLIQLRSSFPPPAHTSLGETLFSSLPEFEVFGRLFDVCFLVSVTVSGVVRWVSRQLNGTGHDAEGWEMVGAEVSAHPS
jgi:Abscisic acid G-protein coupled receptor